MAGPRPFGVTLVAIIAWVTGALQIIGGAFALIVDVVSAITAIVIGIITILVSLGLFRGSNGARIIVTIVFLLNIAGSIWLLVSGGGFFTAIGSLLLPVIGIILLYTKRASAFFS